MSTAAPQTLEELLQTSWTMLRQNWRPLLPFILLYAASFLSAEFFAVKHHMAVEDTKAYFSSHLPHTLIYIITTNLMVYYLYHASQGNKLTFTETVFRVFGRLHYILIYPIIYLVCLTFGFSLLFIPGIILGVSLMFGYAAILFEEKNPFNALAASHKLVWPQWWYSAVILILPVILYRVCLHIAAVSIADLTTEHYATAITGTLITALIIPIINSLYVNLYIELKHRQARSAQKKSV